MNASRWQHPQQVLPLALSDKFSLKELTEQQEDIKEEDMKFSANFKKTSLNNGAKLKFGAKVVRKTKEKEIDFYEYTPKRRGCLHDQQPEKYGRPEYG